jgi:hypothetical protein
MQQQKNRFNEEQPPNATPTKKPRAKRSHSVIRTPPREKNSKKKASPVKIAKDEIEERKYVPSSNENDFFTPQTPVSKTQKKAVPKY